MGKLLAVLFVVLGLIGFFGVSAFAEDPESSTADVSKAAVSTEQDVSKADVSAEQSVADASAPVNLETPPAAPEAITTTVEPDMKDAPEVSGETGSTQ